MHPAAPAPSCSRQLWAVELGVDGHAWRHQWQGHARDSIDATDQARASLFGKARAGDGAAEQLPAVTVLSCLQLGV